MKCIKAWPRAVLFPFFIAIGLLVGGGGTSWLMQTAPVTVIDVSDVSVLSVADGSLDISITLVRNRACNGRVDRWLWRFTGQMDRRGKPVKRWVPLPYDTNPPTQLNEEVTYILSLAVPRNVNEGDWFYFSRTSDSCSIFPMLNSPVRESPNIAVHFNKADLVSRAPRGPESSQPITIRPDSTRLPL